MIRYPTLFRMKGFTLIELLVVLAIIGILLMATIPANTGKIDQAAVRESVQLMRGYQQQVESYYSSNGKFPTGNASIAMPDPERIKGNYLTAAYLEDGALHLQLGNKIRPKLSGKFISLRPIFTPGTENAPISWVCGRDTVPAGMVAAGKNRTEIENYSLPVSCR